MAATKKVAKAKVEVEEEVDYSLNDLLLRGRVSAPATTKELPSGDKVVEIRLIVARDDREGFDTFDIALWSSALRKRALSLKDDEWIEVSGALRRRFWRAGGATASRWQVEGRELKRV